MLTLSHANSSGTRLHRHGFHCSRPCRMHAAALLMLSSVNGSEHDSYMALAIWKATDTGWSSSGQL